MVSAVNPYILRFTFYDHTFFLVAKLSFAIQSGIHTSVMRSIDTSHQNADVILRACFLKEKPVF